MWRVLRARFAFRLVCTGTAPSDRVPAVKGRPVVARGVSRFALESVSRSGTNLVEAAHGVHADEADPVEVVHKLRVAIRRLRADLRIFESAFDADWLAAKTRQLRDLARIVGEVRDLDVILGRLEELGGAATMADQPAVAALVTRLRIDRGAALRRALAAIGDPNRAAVLKDFAEIAACRPLAPNADQVVIEDLVATTRRQWQRLRKSARTADAAPDEENLHRVRVRAKTLRYSLETLAPVLHNSARDHAEALITLQDHLGKMQDADVIERWLRVVRETGGHDDFVVGQLVGLERARKDSVRAQWPAQWKRASRRRLLRWRA